MNDMSSKVAIEDTLAHGARPVMPEPLAYALAHPEEPGVEKPKVLTAYQHFTAMLHLLDDADIETLLCAETDFANFVKPDIGQSQSIASDIAELCNQLIEKRYAEHYAGTQHDSFVSRCGDYRRGRE